MQVGLGQLPAEIVEFFLGFTQEPNAKEVCSQWHVILSRHSVTFPFLQNRMSELGIKREIEKVQQLALPVEEGMQCLKNELVERIRPFLVEKQLLALEQVSSSYSLVMQLLSYEKEGNFLLAFKALAPLNPTLNEIFQDPLFKELSTMKQAAHLRAVLETMKEELKEIQEIDLKGQGLTLLPSELNLFTNVTKVSLAFNSIRHIPSHFSSYWPKIQTLYLNDNQIEELQQGFGSGWKKLKSIFLYANSIKSLPHSFGKTWTKLQTMLLKRNQLEQLPEDFGSNWANLFLMDVARNKTPLDLTQYLPRWPKIKDKKQ